MEEGHLHNGINTRGQATFAGNFRRVNHVEAGFFLIKHRLNLLRQARPDLLCAVWSIQEKNTAGFQALSHLVFIDKLQLVAANKVSLRNKIGRTDRLFTHAQVGNGQTPGFFGVIDKVPLGIPWRRITDDFDVVFGRGDAPVAAQTVEQRLKFRAGGQGVFR